MTTVRLVLLQHRWVVGFAVLVTLATAGAALVAWAALAGVSTPAHCIEDRFLVPIPAECVGTEEFLIRNEELAGKVMAALAVVPLLLGILVGAPLVGSEIETRTATIAWSLGASRRRWLLQRLLLLGLGLGLLLVLPAVAADLLASVRPPLYDMSTATLVDYGLRGPLVVLRGVTAFAIGVLVGLVIGRVLPALLVSGVAVLLLWNLLGTISQMGWPPQETFVPRDDQYYVSLGGAVAEGSKTGPQETVGIPGEKLAFVETREMILLGGLTVVLFGGSVMAIERRRPA
jgi:hypothetical protein